MQKKTWILVCSCIVVLIGISFFVGLVVLRNWNGYPETKLLQGAEFVGYLDSTLDGSEGDFVAIFDVNQTYDSAVEETRKELKGRFKATSTEPDSTSFILPRAAIVSVNRFAVIKDSLRSNSKVTEFREIPNECSVQVMWSDPLPAWIRRIVGIKLPFQ